MKIELEKAAVAVVIDDGVQKGNKAAKRQRK